MPIISAVALASAERVSTTTTSSPTTTEQPTTSSTGSPTHAATTSAASQGASNGLPVGLMAGSIAGGVVLAGLVVLLLAIWGKPSRHHPNEQKSSALTTRDSLHRRTSRLSGSHRKPFSLRSSREKDIYLARNTGSPESIGHSDIGDQDRKIKVSSPDSAASAGCSTPPSTPPTPPQKYPTSRTLKKPRKEKYRVERKPTLSPIIDVDSETQEHFQIDEPPVYAPANLDSGPVIRFAQSVAHKPSTLGSASVYSTQSGEERLYEAPSPFILPASIPPGLDSLPRPLSSISHKPSNVSSVYSNQSGEERISAVPLQFLSAIGQDRQRLSTWTHSSGSLYSTAEEQQAPSAWPRPAVRPNGATQPSRLSQVSYASIDLQHIHEEQSKVGLAYGGEDAM